MSCNIGTTDKIIRIIAGVIIGAIGLYYQSWWSLVGLIPIITALTGFCPFYIPLGIKTCKKN